MTDEQIPALANQDPIFQAVLHAIWEVMNSDEIDQWMENGYGSSSPDILGALEMFNETALEAAKQIREHFERTDLTPEERQALAKRLKAAGGCPHLNTWHNPGYGDEILKCLDCGEENV